MGALALLTVDWSRADTPQTPDFGDEAVARKKRAQQTQQQMSKAVQSKQGNTAPAAPPTAGATEAAAAPKLQRYQSSIKSSRKVHNGVYDSHQRDAHFQWRHLDYTVRLSNGTERKLLTDCFGYARPGLMIALMGASGAGNSHQSHCAPSLVPCSNVFSHHSFVGLLPVSPLSGKSTLLDVLAGKKTAGHMEGEVLLNGKPFDAASFNHTSAYAEQFDRSVRPTSPLEHGLTCMYACFAVLMLRSSVILFCLVCQPQRFFNGERGDRVLRLASTTHRRHLHTGRSRPPRRPRHASARPTTLRQRHHRRTGLRRRLTRSTQESHHRSRAGDGPGAVVLG